MSNVVRRNLLRIILALPLMLGLMSTTAFAADDPLTGSWRLVKRKLPDGTIQTSPAVGGMSTTTVSGVNHKKCILADAGWTRPLCRRRDANGKTNGQSCFICSRLIALTASVFSCANKPKTTPRR